MLVHTPFWSAHEMRPESPLLTGLHWAPSLFRFVARLELRELARASSLSPFHLHRSFRAVTGVSPREFRRGHGLEMH